MDSNVSQTNLIMRNLEEQAFNFKLKNGFTLEEIKRVKKESEDINLTKVMVGIINSAKGGGDTYIHPDHLSDHSQHRLRVLGFKLQYMEGLLSITGW